MNCPMCALMHQKIDRLEAEIMERDATIKYLTAQRDQAAEANRTLTAIIQEIQGGDAPLVGSIQAAKEAVEYSRTPFAKDIARESGKLLDVAAGGDLRESAKAGRRRLYAIDETNECPHGVGFDQDCERCEEGY